MSHPFKPIDAFKSPRFSQIATFMRLPHHRGAAELDVALLGIPYDGGTSYRAGARFGPREIRSQSAMIRPWNPVLRVSPFEALRIADYGDIDISRCRSNARRPMKPRRGRQGRPTGWPDAVRLPSPRNIR